MSSLEAVNKTLGRIEEDTDHLNRNFAKWFLTQERSKLDAEEDRRERKKLFSMLGAAGAAGAGRGGGAGKASGGMNPLGFLNNLPPWAKLLLGVYAGKLAVGAYKVATSPVRLGNKGGEKIVDYYDGRMRKKFEMEAAAVRRARDAENARLLAEIQDGSKAPDALNAPGAGDTSSGVNYTSSADAPLTASRVSPLISSAPKINATPPKIDTRPFIYPDLPKVQTKVADLKNMRIITQGSGTKYMEVGRGFIRADEAIARLMAAGLDAKGNPIPMTSPAIETDFTVDTSSGRQTHTPIGDNGPRVKSAVGKAAVGLGIFDLADTFNSIAKETYGPLSVTNPNPKAPVGSLLVNTVAGAAQAGGEVVDFMGAIYGAITGLKHESNIGGTIGDYIRDSEIGLRLSQEGGEIGQNMVLRKTVNSLAEKTQAILDNALTGLEMVFGHTTSDEVQNRIIAKQIQKGEAMANLLPPPSMPRLSDDAVAAQMAVTNAMIQAAEVLSSISGTGGKPTGQGMLMTNNPTHDLNYNKIEYGIAGSGNATLGISGIK
jgi:hypothetical protein